MDKVCIIGLGISGKAILEYYSDKNVLVKAFDTNENMDVKSFDKYNNNKNLEISFGENPTGDEDVDIVYVSPGLSLSTPHIQRFKRRNIPVTGEVELAYNISKNSEYIGITGTNGKTTTTSMLGDIYKNYKEKTFVAGNIGISLLEMTKSAPQGSTFVTELSSFQLESIIDFRPHIAAILNITPDHIERHKTMENYKAAKYNIVKNQRANDFLVLNKDDPEIDIDVTKINSKVIYFSLKGPVENGVYFDKNKSAIINNLKNDHRVILYRDDIHLLGQHNVENTLAAVTVALLDNVPVDIIKSSITSFKPVKHRMQIVRILNEVTYVNDSKGTNVMSTIKAIESIDSDIILIAGGYDKNVEFDDMVEKFEGKVKKLLLFGKTKYKIMDTSIKHDFKDILILNDLKQAVSVANILAKSGDCVLLSPACASWDMYDSYEKRGEEFIKLVNEL